MRDLPFHDINSDFTLLRLSIIVTPEVSLYWKFYSFGTCGRKKDGSIVTCNNIIWLSDSISLFQEISLTSFI